MQPPDDSPVGRVTTACAMLFGAATGLQGFLTEMPWQAILGLAGMVLAPIMNQWMAQRRDKLTQKLRAETDRANRAEAMLARSRRKPWPGD